LISRTSGCSRCTISAIVLAWALSGVDRSAIRRPSAGRFSDALNVAKRTLRPPNSWLGWPGWLADGSGSGLAWAWPANPIAQATDAMLTAMSAALRRIIGPFCCRSAQPRANSV
jgi:hypothetical protein